MAKHLPYAGRPRYRWLPKVLTRMVRPEPKPPRYDSTWTLLAGGLAFVQDQHSEDHVALEEADTLPIILQEARAAGVPMVVFQPPDQITERRLMWERMSEEARYVIGLILNGPSETMQVIMTPKRGSITQASIRNHLSQKGLPRREVETTMAEIGEFVRVL